MRMTNSPPNLLWVCVAQAKLCGQSVGTGLLDDDPTPISIRLEPSESVSFQLNTTATNAVATTGNP